MTDLKKPKRVAGGVAQWLNVCLACMRPWVLTLVPKKIKGWGGLGCGSSGRVQSPVLEKRQKKKTTRKN
jgi:hypothetical protein